MVNGVASAAAGDPRYPNVYSIRLELKDLKTMLSEAGACNCGK
jgi:hypothetical protein